MVISEPTRTLTAISNTSLPTFGAASAFAEPMELSTSSIVCKQ